MANTKISALPQYSAAVNPDIYFVNNNSGETETTKIQLKTFNGMTSTNSDNSIQSNSWLSNLGTTASTESAIAIGNGAEATSPYSIAIGYLARNENRDGERNNYICIGTNSRAVQESFALGTDSRAFGASTCAIGENAGAFGNGGLSVGKNSFNSSTNGIAIGNGAFDAANLYAIAIGASAQAGSDYSVALGYDSQSDGIGSVAIGSTARTNGDYSITIGGSGHTNSGVNNTIIGGRENTTSTQENAVLLGCSGRTATTSGATFVENLVIFNYTNLDFADDAAAATGGVVLGQVYHTSGDLKIRIT